MMSQSNSFKPREHGVIPFMIILAVIFGFLAFGHWLGTEERAYSGQATVTKDGSISSRHRICDVNVKTPAGSEFDYSFRSEVAYCESLTVGTEVEIEKGKIVG